MAQWSDSSDSSDEEQQTSVVTSIVPSSEEEESDGDNEEDDTAMPQPVAYTEESSDASSEEEAEPKDVQLQENSSIDDGDSDQEQKADIKSEQQLKQESESEDEEAGTADQEESSDDDDDEPQQMMRKTIVQQHESSEDDSSSEEQAMSVVKNDDMSETTHIAKLKEEDSSEQDESSDDEQQKPSLKADESTDDSESSDEDEQTVTTAEEDESSDESSDEEMHDQAPDVAAQERVQESGDEDEEIMSTAISTTKEEVVEESPSDELESSSEDKKELPAVKRYLPTWKAETSNMSYSSSEDSSSGNQHAKSERKTPQIENDGVGSSDDDGDLEAEMEATVNDFVEESPFEEDEEAQNKAKNDKSAYNIVDIVMDDVPDASIHTARMSPQNFEEETRLHDEEDNGKPLVANAYEAQDALWLLHNIFTRVPVPEQTGINRGARPRGPPIQDPLTHVDEFKRKFRWPLHVRNLQRTNFTQDPSEILLDHDITLNGTQHLEFQEQRTSAFASLPQPLIQAVAQSVRKLPRKRKRTEDSETVKTPMTATGLSNLVRIGSRFNDQFMHSLLAANADALQGTDESYPQRSWTPLPGTRKPIANWRFVVEHLHRKNQETTDPLCPKLQPATLRRIRDRLSNLYGLSWQQEDNEFLDRLTQNGH